MLKRHPWLFSGAIAGRWADEGDVVEVYSADGSWLARGYYNSHSQIVVRLLTWERQESVDDGFWRRRVERAVESRSRLPALAHRHRIVAEHRLLVRPPLHQAHAPAALQINGRYH